MRLLACLSLTLLTTTGCATMFSGARDGVRVISDPPGATVSVAGQPAGVTPTKVSVSRKAPEAITIAIPSCPALTVQPTTQFNPMVWANAFLGPMGLGTAFIDFATGSANDVAEGEVGARCIDGTTYPSNRVVVGMTAAQVRQAWGEPQSINRTQSARGTEEQWVYGLGYYVYVFNGVVTAVQTIQ